MFVVFFFFDILYSGEVVMYFLIPIVFGILFSGLTFLPQMVLECSALEVLRVAVVQTCHVGIIVKFPYDSGNEAMTTMPQLHSGLGY